MAYEICILWQYQNWEYDKKLKANTYDLLNSQCYLYIAIKGRHQRPPPNSSFLKMKDLMDSSEILAEYKRKRSYAESESQFTKIRKVIFKKFTIMICLRIILSK